MQLCESFGKSTDRLIKVRRIISSILLVVFVTSTRAPMPVLAQSEGTKPKQSAEVTDSGKSEIEKLLPNRAHAILENTSGKSSSSKDTKTVTSKNSVQLKNAVAAGSVKSNQKPSNSGAGTQNQRAQIGTASKQNTSKNGVKTSSIKSTAGERLSASDLPPVAPPVVKRADHESDSSAERIPRPGQRKVQNTPSDAMRSGTEHSDERISRPNVPPVAPSRKALGDGGFPDSVLPKASPSASSPATTASGSTSSKSTTDLYPQIGKLEQLTFGVTKSELAIEERLLGLENSVFATTYPNDSLFDRTERLKVTLLGKGAVDPPQSTNLEPPTGYVDNPLAGNQPSAADMQYFDEMIERPENYHKAPKAVLDAFALEMINFERERRALGRLDHNPQAQRLADEHIRDLVERNVVSHNNAKGENPDRRYTMIGGLDAINENLAVIPLTELGTAKLCKAAVARVLKQMFMQQDDREALLAPEASHLGFSIEKMNDGARILACIEIMTARAQIQSLPTIANLGDKVEVSGLVQAPFQFDRISLAWEGVSDLPPQDESSDEPLPYFPPLDFVAYKEKSEKDHTKAIFALKTVGVLAAIAGGIFVPPVALAAPMIMMAGPDPMEAKPASDVPIKGGVKVDGSSFNGKVSLSNEGKEGLYYVTVWGRITPEDKPVALSRRAILVKQVHEEEDVEGSVSIPKAEKKDASDRSKLTTDKSSSSDQAKQTNAKSETSAGSPTSEGAVATEQSLTSGSEPAKSNNDTSSSPTGNSSSSFIDKSATESSSSLSDKSSPAADKSTAPEKPSAATDQTGSAASVKSSSLIDSSKTDELSASKDKSSFATGDSVSTTTGKSVSTTDTPVCVTNKEVSPPENSSKPQSGVQETVSPSSGWNEIKAKPVEDVKNVSSGHAIDAGDKASPEFAPTK